MSFRQLISEVTQYPADTRMPAFHCMVDAPLSLWKMGKPPGGSPVMSSYEGERNMVYNIGICQISGAFKLMSGVVVEDLSHLKALLKETYRVEVVNLGCLFTFSDEIRNDHRLFVLVDNLTEKDFTWLVNRKRYEVKFVEFIMRE